MRGHLLSDPAVVGYLQRYLVTAWEGRDHTEPDDLREVIAAARMNNASNVAAYVLSPAGALLHSFHPNPWEPTGRFLDEVKLAEARGRIHNPGTGALRAPLLPGATIDPGPGGSPGGVRVYLTFEREFNAVRPVVEATWIGDADRSALKWPGEAGAQIDPATLGTWLKLVYPPAMMDQDDRVDRVGGTLELTPLPATGGGRRGLLHGRVELLMKASRVFDENGPFRDPRRRPRDFQFTMEAHLIVDYSRDDDRPKALKGYLSGSYLRPDRKHGRDDPIGIQAAIESLPAR